MSVRPNGNLQCNGGLTMTTGQTRIARAHKECTIDLEAPGPRTFTFTTNNAKQAALQIEVNNVRACKADTSACVQASAAAHSACWHCASVPCLNAAGRCALLSRTQVCEVNNARHRRFHRRLVDAAESPAAAPDGGLAISAAADSSLVKAATGSAECENVAEPRLTVTVSPASAEGREGTAMRQLFEVRVNDASGAPVTGKAVRLDISPAAMLTCSPATPKTDTAGRARTTCSGNLKAGTYRVDAKVQACQVTRGTASRDNW